MPIFQALRICASEKRRKNEARRYGSGGGKQKWYHGKSYDDVVFGAPWPGGEKHLEISSAAVNNRAR